mmetsp:Transcript_37531/g.60512  ORF Transcript_37531/g.60512 Transcript_37531/m.60512 type:complete len:88 (-) Transcript_37531:52-315(-)
MTHEAKSTARSRRVDAVAAHMVKDPELSLRDLFRVLRPGGKLLATTLSVTFMPEVIARMATEAGFQDVGMRVPRHGIYLFEAVKPIS